MKEYRFKRGGGGDPACYYKEVAMENDILKETQKIIDEIKTRLTVLTPREVSDFTCHLAANLATLGERLAEVERDYNLQWERTRTNTNTNGRADKVAKATAEYFAVRLYQAKLDATKELIKALKKRQQVLFEEKIGSM